MPSRTLIFLCLLVSADLSSAEDAVCSSADAQLAEKATATMKSWRLIYSGFKRFDQCDDGAIAEGFTESVVHLLATRWNSLSKVDLLVKRDQKFYKFFIRHINASADTDELKKIASLSKLACPTNFEKLCTAINSEAEKAINETYQLSH